MKRLVSALWILLSWVLLSVAAAQLSGEAARTLAEAERAAAQARENYVGVANTPDRPLWREAIRLGEAARELAPGSPEVLRFLGETYSALSWDVRAWGVWTDYLDAGGELDAEALAMLSEAGRRLGYARYNAGDLAGAEAIFARLLDLDPSNLDAVTWLGRIAFERGDAEAARGYWERVLEGRPDDAVARYYLGRTESQLQYGKEASEAFYEGLSAYEAGDFEAALEAFIRAAEANPELEEALTWAGRVALELGRPRIAQEYWGRVLEANPDDERAAYFLNLAEAQLEWGVEAARAFGEGQALYNQGQVGEAAEAFARASDANPQYKEAAVWAARSFQETGQAAQAATYWERVVELDPQDASARYFLEEARAQSGFAPEAVSAFNRGVSAYGVADLEAAQAAFEEAVALDPSYADAWGWLGRIHFERGEYGAAAEAYARALELQPNSETYRFFQQEALRLAAG